jgi:hypothetical protein
MASAASFIGGNVSVTSYHAVRDFSHRTVKISHRTVNLPTEYKQVVIGGILHGENRRFLFMFMSLNIPCSEKKSLTMRELVIDTFPPMNKAANNKLFKF